jgi:hypothetical protein
MSRLCPHIISLGANRGRRYNYSCHEIHSDYDYSTCEKYPCDMCVKNRSVLGRGV